METLNVFDNEVDRDRKVKLSTIFEIMRECSYEYEEANNAEDCIENLIRDILDNID